MLYQIHADINKFAWQYALKNAGETALNRFNARAIGLR